VAELRLVLRVPARFQLEGAVLHVEVVAQAALELVEHLLVADGVRTSELTTTWGRPPTISTTITVSVIDSATRSLPRYAAAAVPLVGAPWACP
jgi:hypothetical protein